MKNDLESARRSLETLSRTKDQLQVDNIALTQLILKANDIISTLMTNAKTAITGRIIPSHVATYDVRLIATKQAAANGQEVGPGKGKEDSHALGDVTSNSEAAKARKEELGQEFLKAVYDNKNLRNQLEAFGQQAKNAATFDSVGANIKASGEQIHTSDSDMMALESKVCSMKKELLKLGKHLAAANASKLAVKHELDSVAKENATLISKVLDSERIIKKLRKELEVVRKGQVHGSHDESSRLRTEFDNFKKVTDITAHKWAKMLSEKNIEINRLRRELEHGLEHEVVDNDREMEELPKQLRQQEANPKVETKQLPEDLADRSGKSNSLEAMRIEKCIMSLAKSVYEAGASFTSDARSNYDICLANIESAFEVLQKAHKLEESTTEELEKCFSERQIRCWVKVLTIMRDERLYSGSLAKDTENLVLVNDRDSKTRICRQVTKTLQSCNDGDATEVDPPPGGTGCILS
jgi:hypothetical protein